MKNKETDRTDYSMLKGLQELTSYTIKNVDYEKIAEYMLLLSGAKYVSLNIFEPDGKEFRTVAIAGVNEHLKKASEIMGFEIVGKKWNYDPEREKKIKDRKTTVFKNLGELSGSVVPGTVLQLLQKSFGIGTVVVVKTEKDGKMVGDFTLIFNTGVEIQNLPLIESYSDITGMLFSRLNAEQELRFKSTIVENIHDSVVTTDTQFKITYMNSAAEKLYGYSPEELLGKTPDIFNAEPMSQEIQQELYETVSSGKMYENTSINRRKDGSLFYCEYKVKPITDESGKIIFFVGVQRDISERKIAEQKITEAKEQYQSLVKNIPGITFRCKFDKDWTMLFMSDAVADVSGYPADEFLNNEARSYESVIYRDDRKYVEDSIHAAIKEKRHWNIEYRIEHKSGEIRWVQERGNRIFDQIGGVFYLDGFILDITDRKKVEEQLRESEARFKSIIAVSNTGAWEYHRDKDYLWCSPEYFTMLGYDPGKFTMDGSANLAQTWIDLLHPDDRDRASAHFADYLAGGSVGMYENYFRMKHRDGGWVWIWSRGQTLRDGEGKMTQKTVGTHIDITEQKQYEEKLLFSERTYKEIFNNSSNALFIHDIDTGAIVDVNNTMLEMYGYERQEIAELGVADLSAPMEPYSNERAGQLIKKAASGETVVFEWLNRKKNGELFYSENILRFVNIAGIDRIMAVVRDISDKKRLENTNQSLLNIIDLSQDFIGIAGKEQGAFFVNPAGQKMVGLDGPDEVNKTNIDDYFLEEDLPFVKQKILPALLSEGRWSGEFRFRHFKTGKAIPILYDLFLTENPETGELTNITTISRDITDRKQAEKALRESEEKYRDLFDSNKDGIMHTDPDGVILDVNQALLEMTGYRNMSELQESYQKMTPKKWHEFEEEIVRNQVFKRGYSDDYEKEYIRKDGTVFPIRCRVWVRKEDEKITGMWGIVQDITERKQAEDALRESEAKLSALFASMTEMVVMHELVFDGAGKPVNYRITDCNAAFSRITGIRREDAVGKLATEVYATPEVPYLEEFARVGITGEPYHNETYFAPMDKHFAISVVSPGKNRFATITADISEAKRIQAVIDGKNKELEQLIYVASHDLRSPLVNVDGFSRELGLSMNDLTETLNSGKGFEALEKKIRTEFSDMEKSISRIRSSAAQMDGLLKGLLKLSRAGRSAQSITDIDMNELIEKLVASFAFKIKETEIELTVDDLPYCHGDAMQLTQVFANLIDNAIKYRHDERKGKIQITGKMEMGRAVYRVVDNGSGIAENHIEHIFELFHRLEPGKTEGDGLGLTIARQSLSRMYGEIKAESEPGKGSTFIVILPPAKKRKLN